ncbi:hypothetical protein EDD27_0702 [Nonomuraea polychroma]|uniref:Uncharacterized protein n=1 Tax=Nonomuraea polychroma TaxID=46176 RepID=A0A438LYH5_9ACTN|nr:hypothetical protein EDD27_0702 [Nonomuraea polychroma]
MTELAEVIHKDSTELAEVIHKHSALAMRATEEAS